MPTRQHGAPVELHLQPISSLRGAGPRVAEKLAARGLGTLQDLWLLLPRQYEDRTALTPIRALQPGVAAQIEGRVEAVERGFRYRPTLRVAIGDGSRATVVLRFFHFRAAQAAQFRPGARVRCYGTPRPGLHGLEIVHPSYRLLDDEAEASLSDTLDPVYPALEGVGPAVLRRLIQQALERLPDEAALELLPAELRAGFRLPSLREALLTVHRPQAGDDVAALLAGRHPAQRRLALEELLAHHLSLRRQRLAQQAHAAPALRDASLAERLRAALPFALTGAQRRVFDEIRADLARPRPMLRLVQGDVGSGKTVVAALAAMLAVAAGKQAALMAPTELLAEQHLANLRGWLAPLGVRVAWLAGKVTGRARAQTLAQVASGEAQVVVGTHALMQEGVAFRDLALAIVDEQHRFGVHQRLALRDKGVGGRVGAGAVVPHQLVMTATPIPRTLAMAAYADLDVSSIDELPPGRTPVQTVALGAERRPELIERIRRACAEGRQAYWVCTLIDENEDEGKPGGGHRVEAQAAQSVYEELSARLPELRVGLVHGRMKPAQKQAAMQAFKAGATDLLVATTVIEVGVDVPNASLMIVENAERLGLAQLHQLRGRVGRGRAASTCVLLYQPPLSAMARERLATMRETNDGFVIAEKDLELRGPGELLGTRQTGLAAFRVADLARDADLLPQVQRIGERLLQQAPEQAERLVARWVGGAARYAGA
ncbi:ATP-dependent DNA helicase RecG [Vulcaniibacterium tengchongense]|uniref:ATP-dependent DNA helicase RecG n=1 Tax=Vulcaniibacterium tengchongense TaxID=1273429 RepID=A0A3N4UVQ1_9GAMM|nr:ATP-dependent DNA helicase RecG [Vulcaniibacterium tengchongense]RPE74842.1 ATP-dependent DNA helicase RecG [Vulcaniibacterium tengchongense]